MKNTLEGHKWFPYIAWATVIGFALFTYMITTHVRAELSSIDNGFENGLEKYERMEEEWEK